MSKAKKEIEKKIINLVFLAETNLECCKILWEYIMEEKGGKYIKKDFQKIEKTGKSIYDLPPKKQVDHLFFVQSMARYFMLVFINHFFETVFVLSSLLWPTNKKEISFKLYFEEKSILSINKLKKEFKEKKFLQMRHNIMAHKNFFEIKDIFELVDIVSPVIKKRKIRELDKIVQKLKVETYLLFKNSYFERKCLSVFLLSRKMILISIKQ